MKHLVLTVASLALVGFVVPAIADDDGTHHLHHHPNPDDTASDITVSKDVTGDVVAFAPIINNDGEEIGRADIIRANNGVLVNIAVSGLPAGKRGMHFHEVGSCDDHDHFKEAGGHIEKEKPHGFLHPEGPHAGNLPNLVVYDDGSANVELYSNLVSVDGDVFPLLDDNGSTLMIHANIDDHVTQPIGGSGARIACGVIQAK
ncbi:MAG: superoxide dismutase family protein [Bdellovibrionales bacterium]